MGIDPSTLGGGRARYRFRFDGTGWTSRAALEGFGARLVGEYGERCLGGRRRRSYRALRRIELEREPFPEGEGGAPDAGKRPALLGITGTSKSDVWAVGEGGTVLHFDGMAWSNPTSGTLATLRAVWADAKDDAWAVGDGGVVLHFDGAAWMPDAPDAKLGVTAPLYAVQASSKSDVWVAGGAGTIAHFDGMAWTARSSSPASRSARCGRRRLGLGCGGSRSVWRLATVAKAEGGAPEGGDSATVASDATSDAARKKMGEGGERHQGGASRPSGATHRAIFGSSAQRRDPALERPELDRRGDGSSSNRLAISGTSPDDAWIVGDEMLHNAGEGWARVDSGTDRSLYAISFGGPGSGWTVGTEERIAHLGGADAGGWTIAESPSAKWLRGVWTSGATAGWVVGGGGTTLALLNGTAWQAVPTGGVSVDLLDVWGSKVDDVWAVGEAGTILHWRGTMWALSSQRRRRGTSNALRGVWGSGPRTYGPSEPAERSCTTTARPGCKSRAVRPIRSTTCGAASDQRVGGGNRRHHPPLGWYRWKASDSGTNASLNGVGAREPRQCGQSARAERSCGTPHR